MVGTITEESRGELTPEELERLTFGLIEAHGRLHDLDFGQRDPGFVQRRVKPRHMKMWRRLAVALHARGISFRRYIYWAHKQYRRFGPYVFVGQIASPKTLQWYDREAPDHEHDVALLIRLQWSTLKQALDEGMTPREIIGDSSLELGVVFKYALARNAQLTDLAESMREAAESEMYFEPGYRRHLASLLPSAE